MLGTKERKRRKVAGAPNQSEKCWYVESVAEGETVFRPVSAPRAGCLIVAVVEEAEPQL